MQTNEMFAFWKGGATEQVRDGFLNKKSRREPVQSATTCVFRTLWINEHLARQARFCKKFSPPYGLQNHARPDRLLQRRSDTADRSYGSGQHRTNL